MVFCESGGWIKGKRSIRCEYNIFTLDLWLQGDTIYILIGMSSQGKVSWR